MSENGSGSLDQRPVTESQSSRETYDKLFVVNPELANYDLYSREGTGPEDMTDYCPPGSHGGPGLEVARVNNQLKAVGKWGDQVREVKIIKPEDPKYVPALEVEKTEITPSFIFFDLLREGWNNLKEEFRKLLGGSSPGEV
ncbi:hypothetical protein COT75_03490 [Candidatus Beckwithbacteria bacterium CG10_big_fil_rev_8_21_14_0_10_34_10]|uniref:Uncharacterized protein n=1 Tax=Candidatus Beckwithbacteria bacterium CG10_big_fil_rev_8_21_14_0_10_34_10 TaxID=1974495 RepID=A0A2H0W8R0_9BACT|nr:MAG: hypothetical protein COT75_03490 [Candidatus Beckwithbacteria bacterium CG10_big_fil_rev_8_21_14_0_10_34_10]